AAQQGDRMRAHRNAQGLVVGDDLFADARCGQRGGRFVETRGLEQRRQPGEAGGFPLGLRPMAGERTQGIGPRQGLEVLAVEPRLASEVLHAVEGEAAIGRDREAAVAAGHGPSTVDPAPGLAPAPRLEEALDPRGRQPAYPREAEPDRRLWPRIDAAHEWRSVSRGRRWR